MGMSKKMAQLMVFERRDLISVYFVTSFFHIITDAYELISDCE